MLIMLPDIRLNARAAAGIGPCYRQCYGNHYPLLAKQIIARRRITGATRPQCTVSYAGINRIRFDGLALASQLSKEHPNGCDQVIVPDDWADK